MNKEGGVAAQGNKQGMTVVPRARSDRNGIWDVSEERERRSRARVL